MPCPTCDHTLSPIRKGVFHCPRCGTLVWLVLELEAPRIIAPALVTRCREFEQAIKHPATEAVGANLRLLWHTEGIDEAIYRPEDRK